MMAAVVEPTLYDYGMACKAAFERKKLYTFNKYLKRIPHLFSYVNVEIHPHRELQKHNPDFANSCIYVRLKGSLKFCKKMNCVATYTRGKSCKANDTLKIFKSGNTTVAACQHACFHLLQPYNVHRTQQQHTNDDELNKIFQLPTFYDDECATCLYTNQMVFARAIDDFNRTEVHPTPNVDTIGTGFDVHPRPYIDQATHDRALRFALNSYYCDNFSLNFNAEKRECEESWGEYLAGFIIGSYLAHSIKYSVKQVFYKGESFNDVKRPNVPKISDEEKLSLHASNTAFYDYDEAAFAINPNVTLDQLGFTSETMHMYFTTEYGWPGRLVEPLLIWKEVSNIPDYYRHDKTMRRALDEYELLGLKSANYGEKFNEILQAIDFDKSAVEKIFAASGQILETLLAIIVVNKAVFAILRPLLGMINKAIVAPAIVFACRSAATLVTSKMIASILSETIVEFVSMTAMRVTASIAVSVGASLVSVALIAVMIVAFVVEIVLVITDPLHMRAKLDQDGVDLYSQLDISLKKVTMGFGTPELSPILLATVIETIEAGNFEKKLQQQPPPDGESIPRVDIPLTARKTDPNLGRNNPPREYGYRLENIESDNASLQQQKQTIIDYVRYIAALKYNSDGGKINYSKETPTFANDMIDGAKKILADESIKLKSTVDNVIQQLEAKIQETNNYIYKLLLCINIVLLTPTLVQLNSQKKIISKRLLVLLVFFIVFSMLLYYNFRFFSAPQQHNDETEMKYLIYMLRKIN